MHDDHENRPDAGVRPTPKAWVPRAEEWAEKAVPMPAWAKAFARTGKLPPESERVSNDPGGTPESIEEEESTRRYEKHWRSIIRLIDSLKADAAAVFVKTEKNSPLANALAARMFDLDEELDRLHALHRNGAPLVLGHFPPVDPSNAGRNVARVEKDRRSEPLFQAIAPDDFSDVVGMGGMDH